MRLEGALGWGVPAALQVSRLAETVLEQGGTNAANKAESNRQLGCINVLNEKIA